MGRLGHSRSLRRRGRAGLYPRLATVADPRRGRGAAPGQRRCYGRLVPGGAGEGLLDGLLVWVVGAGGRGRVRCGRGCRERGRVRLWMGKKGPRKQARGGGGEKKNYEKNKIKSRTITAKTKAPPTTTRGFPPPSFGLEETNRSVLSCSRG